MSNTAKFVKEIEVIDPDSKGVVHMAVYKHSHGGMFAIDSSFITEVLDDEESLGETPHLSIYDPFADMGEPDELHLED